MTHQPPRSRPRSRSSSWHVTRNHAAKTDAERDEILADPGFGKHFTDHMVDICWSEKGGWHRPRVQPYGPITLDPAAAVLHYAQEIFEGLKAYRHADGSIWTFRPDQNAAPHAALGARASRCPSCRAEYFIESLRAAHRGRRRLGADRARDEPVPAAVHVREGGVPRRAPGAEGRLLRDRVARPAPTSTGGVQPGVDLALDEDYARAGKGGTGAAKTGGNYAASPAAAGRGVRERLRSRCSSSTEDGSTSRSSAA